MDIYSQVCGCSIKKSNWEKLLKTRKHGIVCGDIVVEEIQGHKGLEMFRGENATCNGCVAHREKWAGNNPEKIKELWQNYHVENRGVINEKRKHIIKLMWIVLCVGVR